MLASFALLAIAMKSLPLGVSYAVWVGIGAVGSAIVGVVMMGERLSTPQILCLAFIAAGIVGLRVLAPQPASGVVEIPSGNA
jgi:quaternary ammonium compound-resistance protein SugE